MVSYFGPYQYRGSFDFITSYEKGFGIGRIYQTGVYAGEVPREPIEEPGTISRRLVANGLHSCRPLRRLPLTPPNRRQRLEWCRARSTWMTEWHRVVFSDESRFCLSSDSRRVRVWRRRGERSNPAAIGTMTAQRYVDDVLRPVTLPYLQGVPNALYQQDNARPHTARISQQALQDVQMLPWPPYSPDLSPIEHVWDIIGRRLHALPQPRSEDELWQMLVTATPELDEQRHQAIHEVVSISCNYSESRQDNPNEGHHSEEGKKTVQIEKRERAKMEEQTNPSNDTAEQSVPKQETTFEEEETSPPQGTSTDPLTQIADTLSKLLVARSPREIDVSPYDGTFEAQSFFDNFDAQADRAELTYTDRLRKLPCYLQVAVTILSLLSIQLVMATPELDAQRHNAIHEILAVTCVCQSWCCGFVNDPRPLVCGGGQ
ncbi:hypothetical protein LAZ67_15001514 [Cordylochernes scorpioides]|uniref:Transposase n=1 Tax=Cordylochernes scorpioides TaxID=51811 RepID=A0ABY6LAU3_9ARAC|nr:hypothetical protein LAZ67_15001514 [Cordylochernes scorpioides]